MKAISYYEYGTVDRLVLNEVSKPEIKAFEVLIRVHAVSVNDFDLGMLMGKPAVLRMSNGFKKPKKITILGSDVAGVVEVVGQDVTHFRVGDPVFGDLSDKWGGFAEYCVAHENEVLALKHMPFETAAALPQAGALAYQGLFDYGNVKSGDEVLINGAGGGVGTLGVQMATGIGAKVDGVDKSSKFDDIRPLGFRTLIDYNETDFRHLDQQYDIILDNKLNRSIFKGLKALKPGGRYLIIGGDSWKLLQAFLLGPIIKGITKKEVRLVVLKKNKGLDHLQDLYNAGQLKVIMGNPWSLEQGIEAIKAYQNNEFTGKVVIELRKHESQ